MAATNFTPIILYHTTTASAAPTAGNLNNGELAINITDGKLFYKDNGGTVQVIATKGTGTIGGSNTQVQYNSSGALAGSANFTFNGTTATINTLNLTNALGTAYGGTALTTYTQGDLVYASAANTLAKLGIGANTYILTSTGSVPQWSAPSAVTVSTANNLAGGAAGSVPYQSGASTTTFLSIGSAGQVLTSSGSAPQWSSPAALTKTDDTNVTLTLGGSASTALVNAASLTLGWTGQLSIARGGTNATATPTAGSVAYGTGTAYAFTSAGSSGQILTSSGAGAPTWTSLSSVGVTTFSAGTTGFTPSTATSGAITLAGTLATTNGGTGLTSFTANGLVYATSTSALTTGSALTYVGENLTVTAGSTGGTTGFTASNSAALGYTALTLKNTGASGKTYEVGVGGNGTAGNYQNNLYIRDTSGNPILYLNTSGVNVVGNFTSTLDATIYGITVGRGAGAVSTNTAVGASALNTNTTGARNVAVGGLSSYSNSTGSSNIFVGYQAGYYNTTSYNIGIGDSALVSNTSGASNVAVGHSALQANTTASNNTAVGYQAGYSNTTGTYNVLIGYRAGDSITTNGGNCIVGPLAGIGSTGQANTFVGALVPGVTNGCGTAMTTGSKNTIIGGFSGNGGGLDIRTASNYIVLSDGDGNPRGIVDGSGNYIVGTTSATATSLSKSLAAAKSHTYVAQSANSNSTAFANQRTVAFLDLDSSATNSEYATSGLLINNYSGLGNNPGAMIRAYHQRFGVSSDNPLRVFEINYLGNIGLGDTDATTSGTGITFPATQNASSNANTLDDYEQGTFTPTVGGTWTTSPTSLNGTYVKIGRQVYITVIFQGAATKATAISGWIDSLPFTVVAEGTGSVSDNAVGNAGNVLFANSTRMWLTANSFIGGANYFSGTYLTAD